MVKFSIQVGEKLRWIVIINLDPVPKRQKVQTAEIKVVALQEDDVICNRVIALINAILDPDIVLWVLHTDGDIPTHVFLC